MPPKVCLHSPITQIAHEDGPKEIVLAPPTPGTDQWSQLKIRNKCNRMVLFRMRLEGNDTNHFRIQPIEAGILAPFDSQLIELAVSHGVKMESRSITVESAFVQENTIPTKNVAILDATEIWKNVDKDHTTKQVVPIRFDQSLKPGEPRQGGAVNVVVMDPRDPPWLMNLRIYEIYGFARSQHPEQADQVVQCILVFLMACFVAGFLLGLKSGSKK